MGGTNSVLIHVGDTIYPYEVKILKAPDDWVEPAPNTSKGGPTFNKLDKPGGWIIFSYRHVFESGAQGGQYKANCLTDGFQIVPPIEYDTALNKQGEWFFYQGWKNLEEKGGVREDIAE